MGFSSLLDNFSPKSWTDFMYFFFCEIYGWQSMSVILFFYFLLQFLLKQKKKTILMVYILLEFHFFTDGKSTPSSAECSGPSLFWFYMNSQTTLWLSLVLLSYHEQTVRQRPWHQLLIISLALLSHVKSSECWMRYRGISVRWEL